MPRRVPLFLALAALSPVALRADAPVVTTREFLNYCTAGAFHTCASVRIQVMSTAAGSVLLFQVQNREGNSYGYDNIGPSSIRSFQLRHRDPVTYGIAFDSLPGLPWPSQWIGTSGAVGSLGQAPAMWDASLDGLGHSPDGEFSFSEWYLYTMGKGIFGCDALPIDPNAPENEMTPLGYSGAYQTCAPAGQDGWVNVWLAVDIPSTAEDWDFSWSMDAAGGYGGCSTAASSDCVTVTPEPVSLALVATGLAGMALVGRRRRAPH